MIASTGPGPPPGVNPTALRSRELWVRQEDGTEVKLFTDAVRRSCGKGTG